jgi:lipoyl(octanoyl) transferase
MEQCLIELLASYGVTAAAKPDAPGVYVDGAKIASLGLRIRHGCSFHGLALNVDMDLEPFRRINPAAMPGWR